MASTTHSLILGTNSNWEQTANYSSDPSNNWRSLCVSANLDWPEDLLVNGRHNGIEMNWRVECYDNIFTSNTSDSENELGQISFQKDMDGNPGGIIVLSLKNNGFQELWDRATRRLLGKITIVLEVIGILPSDSEQKTRWLTSQADRLFVHNLEIRFNQNAPTESK